MSLKISVTQWFAGVLGAKAESAGPVVVRSGYLSLGTLFESGFQLSISFLRK
jgi:hypothetical protein